MKVIKLLPLILASLHAVFAGTVFWLASHSPGLALLPVVVFYTDYPFSIVLDVVTNLFDQTGSLESSLWPGVLTFVVLGSLWYYCIGIVLRALLLRSRTA